MADPYQALYRRYRSKRFGELRGQDHVVRALRTAVAEDRVGHAYLFSGPRGTGKTSTARILAKVLNCEHPVDGEPDGTCPNCVAVDEGRIVDWLLELDAASNNGVANIRELIERIPLGTSGNRKVVILDEVHMLSAGAANALLKSLEEPPAHVVFILCTTDPQKVLPTIRSRTQHFEFHLLNADELADHVRFVIEDAGLGLGEDAVEHVVRQGGGSARDALSALDQVSAMGGVVEQGQPVDAILEALTQHDAGAALVAVADAVASGRDPRSLGEVLIGSAAGRLPRRDEGPRPAPAGPRPRAGRGPRCRAGRGRAHPGARRARRGARRAGQEARPADRARGGARPAVPPRRRPLLRRHPRSARAPRAGPGQRPGRTGSGRRPPPRLRRAEPGGLAGPRPPPRRAGQGRGSPGPRAGEEGHHHAGRPPRPDPRRPRPPDPPGAIDRGATDRRPVPVRAPRPCRRRGRRWSRGSRAPRAACSATAASTMAAGPWCCWSPRAPRPTSWRSVGPRSRRPWRRSSGRPSPSGSWSTRAPRRARSPSTPPRPPAAEDEVVDVHELENAPDAGSGVDRLAEAFPGAELVEE